MGCGRAIVYGASSSIEFVGGVPAIVAWDDGVPKGPESCGPLFALSTDGAKLPFAVELAAPAFPKLATVGRGADMLGPVAFGAVVFGAVGFGVAMPSLAVSPLPSVSFSMPLPLPGLPLTVPAALSLALVAKSGAGELAVVGFSTLSALRLPPDHQAETATTSVAVTTMTAPCRARRCHSGRLSQRFAPCLPD